MRIIRHGIAAVLASLAPPPDRPDRTCPLRNGLFDNRQ